MRAPFPWFGGKRRVAAEVWFSPACLTAPAQLDLLGAHAPDADDADGDAA